MYPEAHNDLGVIYIRKNMYDEAIEALQKTLGQQSDDGSTALNLALAYQMKGNVQMARQTLQTYVEKYGNSGSQYVAQALERLALLK